MIPSFRSKALKRYWARDDASDLRADWRGKVQRVMALLDQATEPSDLDLPGYGLHALTGNRAGRFSITISRNWRLTFPWIEGDAADVELEDDHGT